MKITFLGHAGFCVETSDTVVITDPWLSPTGAFDSAWFQLPRNHHLAAFVQEKLGDSHRERFVYISHEHKDHLDLAFLDSLRCRDFTVVIPDFRRDYLVNAFADYRCKDVVACGDGDSVAIPGGFLKLYLDDSELNRDSAILVRTGGRTFLNLNDCRIVDELPGIARQEGTPDVFACQFSGAGWHPTCYEYSREQYEAIARKKVRASSTASRKPSRRSSRGCTSPLRDLPASSTPLSFTSTSSRSTSSRGLRRSSSISTAACHARQRAGPSSCRATCSTRAAARSSTRPRNVSTATATSNTYGTTRVPSSPSSRLGKPSTGPQDGGERVLGGVKSVLEAKLTGLTLHDRVHTPLYFRLDDLPARMLRVDFPTKTVEEVDGLSDGDFYSMTAPSWEVARVLDGKITWDDFSLTFRMRLNREPDIYHTVVQGFLRLEPEDMNRFCERLLRIETNQERIVVECNGTRYAVDRYCPHQGGDLRRAWVEEGRFLTCARHQWQFDLENEGAARHNVGSMHAVCLDDD